MDNASLDSLDWSPVIHLQKMPHGERPTPPGSAVDWKGAASPALGRPRSGPALVVCALALAGCGGSLVCGEDLELLELDAGDGSFLYQQDVLPALTIELEQQAWDALGEVRSDPRDDVHADLWFAGQEYDVGLHLKGFDSFRPIQSKPSFKIDLGEWVDGATLHGVRRLTLNNNIQDASMMAEELSFQLMAQMGVPSPRHGYVCVTVNGEPYGLYGVVETMDEQFLASRWQDSSGNLYEREEGADLQMDLVERYVLKEQGQPANRADLYELVAALDAAGPDQLMDVLEARFAVDALFDMWAVDLVVGNVDGYVRRGNNYYLYREPSSDLWWMIPWDENQAFWSDLDVHAPNANDPDSWPGRLYRQCSASDACVARLDQHLLEVVDMVEAMDLAGESRALRERIRDSSRHDPKAEFGRMATKWAQYDVVRFIQRRPDQVRQQLEDGE